MTKSNPFSLLAILYELNRRELEKKLIMFPEEVRFYVILANSVIGLENAMRIKETPEAVVKDGEGFVSKLLEMINPARDNVFRDILETYLIETMKDELRFCCANCRKFPECLDTEHLPVGDLFERRVRGEDTDMLRRELTRQAEAALQKTPYVDSDAAHEMCGEFIHQYDLSNIGELFGRYAEIAVALRNSFGIDNKRVLQEMVLLNMRFCERFGEHR